MTRTIIERMKLERRITWAILAVLVALALIYRTFFTCFYITYDDYPADEAYFISDSDR